MKLKLDQIAQTVWVIFYLIKYLRIFGRLHAKNKIEQNFLKVLLAYNAEIDEHKALMNLVSMVVQWTDEIQ